MLPGCHPPIAAALEAAVTLAVGPLSGSLVEVPAAAALAVLALPSSRREAANAVHASGANAGTSPLPPPVANHDNRFEPIPATDVDATARGTAAAGTAVFTDSTATAGAAATCTLAVDAPDVTPPETVEVLTARGTATSVVMVVVVASLAEPALPPDGVTTTGLLLAWRGPTAAAEDAPLRGVELPLSAEPAELETPERRGEVAFVDEVDAPPEA